MYTISIVSVVLNDCYGLKNTLRSIWEQTYGSVELIVIDGGSIDGTAEYVRSVREKLAFFVSEPDNGIYDAMNKGLKSATGDFVLFLNAGDTLSHSETLDRIVGAVDDIDAVYFGRAENLSSAESWYLPPYSVDETNYLKWLATNLPNHQAMLFPRSFYQNNSYITTFRISGDAEYKRRALRDCPVRFVDTVVTGFRLGGVSSALSQIQHAVCASTEGVLISLRYIQGLRRYVVALRSAIVPIVKFCLNNLLGDHYWTILSRRRR